MEIKKFKLQYCYELTELINKSPLIFSTGSYFLCILVVLKSRITQIIPFQLEALKREKRDGTEIKFLNNIAFVYIVEIKGWRFWGFKQCEQCCYLNSIKFLSQIDFSLVYQSPSVGNLATSGVGIPLFFIGRLLDISKVACVIDIVVGALKVWQAMATVTVRLRAKISKYELSL